MERKTDRQVGVAPAVMWELLIVVMKRELSLKAKPSIYLSIYDPTLTYGHELLVATKRTRLRIQVAKMTFLHRVAGLTLGDSVWRYDIREEIKSELLRPHVKRSQMRWLGHLSRMFNGGLALEIVQEHPNRKRSRQTQNTPEELHTPSDLGKILDASEEAEGCGWGEGCMATLNGLLPL